VSRRAEGSTVEALRRAWAAADAEARAGEPVTTGGERPASERIWRAVAGELPPAEVRELAAAAARDGEVAEAWRLARELHAALPADAARVLTRTPWRVGSAAGAPLRWALAATLAAAIGAGLWLRLGPVGGSGGEQPIRGGEPAQQIAPAIPDGAVLSRRDLVLRWSPLSDGEARYTLRLTTAELEVLAEARDLAAAEYRVPAELLEGVPAGSTLLWQVDARLPDGRVLSSSTARLVLRD
jgi:hypothetical protein